MLGGVAHGDQPARAHHQVDLAALEVVCRRARSRGPRRGSSRRSAGASCAAAAGSSARRRRAGPRSSCTSRPVALVRRPDRFACRSTPPQCCGSIAALSSSRSTSSCPGTPSDVTPGSASQRPRLRTRAAQPAEPTRYHRPMATSLAESTVGAAAGAGARVAAREPAGGLDRGDRRRRRRPRRPRCVPTLDVDDWLVRLGEAGYATPTWPAEYGAGLSLSPLQARQVGEVIDRYRVPRPWNILGHRHGRSHGDRVGHRGAEAPLPARHRHEPGDLVPALQRAGRGFRRRRAQHERGARRRRVDRERPEGLDHARPRCASTGCSWPAPIPTSRSTEVSATSSSTCTRRAWRCGRSCRSPVTPSSTRCSSPTRASPTPPRIGPEGEGWRVALTTLMNERVSLSGAGSAGGRGRRRQLDRRG